MCIVLGGDYTISRDGHMLPYRAMEAQAELSRCSFCAQPPSNTKTRRRNLSFLLRSGNIVGSFVTTVWPAMWHHLTASTYSVLQPQQVQSNTLGESLTSTCLDYVSRKEPLEPRGSFRISGGEYQLIFTTTHAFPVVMSLCSNTRYSYCRKTGYLVFH